jgi:FkbM family methyltransferase
MHTVEIQHGTARFVIATHGTGDFLANYLSAQRDFYEADLLGAARAVHRPGTLVCDIGANIGNHTLYFAGVLGAEVEAFEPYGPSFVLLARNVAAHGLEARVRLHETALGAATGRARITGAKPGNPGTARAEAGCDGDIPLTTLADALQGRGPVGTIKVDVEGGELEVLQGAAEILRRDRPAIFVEVATEEAWRGVRGLLSGLGYLPKARFCATPTVLFMPTAACP